MDSTSQKARILAYCAHFGSITVREAFEKLNINSPTKRISELRHSPLYEVDSIDEERVKDDGSTVRYKRYFIKEAADGCISH